MIKKILAAILAVQIALPSSVFAYQKPNSDLTKSEVALALQAMQKNNRLTTNIALGLGATTALSVSYAGYLYYRLNKVNAKIDKFVGQQREVKASLDALTASLKKTTGALSKRVSLNSNNVRVIAENIEEIGSALSNHAQAINANAEGVQTILEGGAQLIDNKPRRPIGYRADYNTAQTIDAALKDILDLKNIPGNKKLSIRSAKKILARNSSKTAIGIGVLIGIGAIVSVYISDNESLSIISNNRVAIAKELNDFATKKTDFFIIAAKEIASTSTANETLTASIIAEDKALNKLFREQLADFNSKEAREVSALIAQAFVQADNDDGKISDLKSSLQTPSSQNIYENYPISESIQKSLGGGAF